MLPPQSVRTGLALSIIGLVFGLDPMSRTMAQSIVRSGSESVILAAPSGEQVWPAAAISAAGGWVVWEDNTIEGPGKGRGIAAARVGSGIGAEFAATGSPIRVNARTAGSQEKPQVALLTEGNALVSWESRFTAGTANAGLAGRIIAPNGSFASDEFQISPGSTSKTVRQKARWTGIFRNRTRTRTFKFKEKISDIREHAGGASLVALPDGGSVVVYHGVHRTYTNTWTLIRETKYNGVRSVTNDYLRPIRLAGDWMQDVYWQRFDAAGRKVGPEVQVNQYDRFNQRDPSVALLANGNLLIAWVSERAQSPSPTANFAISLYAREMTTSGEPVSDEFPVGEDGARASANPLVVTMGSVGSGFGIYWSQHEALFSARWNVYGRVFDSAGKPASEPTLINVHTTGDQYAPRVASSPSSDLAQIIVWTSVGQDGSREGVYARSLVGGLPVGDELQVHTTTASRQHQPVVSCVADGRFVAIWSGYSGNSGFDLYTQSFTSQIPDQQ